MPRPAPVVASRTAQGPAFLVAWERLPDGSWGAHVAWVEVEGERWRGRPAHVGQDDLTKIVGQGYSAVPRRSAG